MQNNLSVEGLYINDFHRMNSMVAQREVLRMSLHPFSREQKIQQIQAIKKSSAISKESANAQRSRKNLYFSKDLAEGKNQTMCCYQSTTTNRGGYSR